MSAFLGHIHYWLYKKIQLVAQREECIFASAGNLCGDLAEEVREQVYQSYGYPLPDKDLGELIDQGNIHGWLQRQINIVETREAAAIQAIVEQCGDAATELIGQTFETHGQECGKQATATGKYALNTATGLYQALNDFRLNGMPCDHNDEIISAADREMLWRSQENLAARNWQRAGADAALIQSFTDRWMAGFVQAANPTFTYCRTEEDKRQLHRIGQS